MRRALRIVFVGVPLSLMALALCEQPAAAQDGACRATVNGVDHTRYNTPKRALRVRHDQTLAVTGFAANYRPEHENANLVYLVQLELAGAKWTVTSGIDDGESWNGNVNVADYATRGQGIYKVIAVTQTTYSGTCFGRAYIKVEGEGGALSTTAGQVAAGVGAVGLAGAFAAGAKGSKEVDDVVNETVVNFLDDQSRAPETSAADDEEAARAEMKQRHAHELTLLNFCLPLVLVAAAATVKAVANDIGHHVTAAIGGWLR